MFQAAGARFDALAGVLAAAALVGRVERMLLGHLSTAVMLCV